MVCHGICKRYMNSIFFMLFYFLKTFEEFICSILYRQTTCWTVKYFVKPKFLMYNWKCQKSHFSDFHFLMRWSTFLESFLVIIRHSWGMFTDRDHCVFSLKEGHLERFGQSDGKHMVSVKRALRTPQTSSFMFKDSLSSFHPK